MRFYACALSVLAKSRERFVLDEAPTRAGYGLLLEEKHPVWWQLPNIERSWDQIAVGHSIKDAHPWCRRGRIVHSHV